jgi:hypothetical protein
MSWMGCPAILACWHYLQGAPIEWDDEDGEHQRPTALCRACSRHAAKVSDARKKREKGEGK